MNQSLIENSPHFSQEKPNRNSNSQVSFNLRNQPAANLHLTTKQPQAINQIGQKFNFVPQIYESSTFNKTHDFGNPINESKKVKKTGLSIFKANQLSTKGWWNPSIAIIIFHIFLWDLFTYQPQNKYQVKDRHLKLHLFRLTQLPQRL